ncbi:MAG: hypothetical protein EAY75_04075 [Bacteroidetes bacterium]|nr:MAG: hypothetical protein EAY75_04075 [Bacteroidota bacterium]
MCATGSTYGQLYQNNAPYWAKQMARENAGANQQADLLRTMLEKMQDSALAFSIIDSIWNTGNKQSSYFNVRYHSINNRLLYLRNYPNVFGGIKGEILNRFSKVINLAYETEDDELIYYASAKYGEMATHLKEPALAIMYNINALELREKLEGMVQPDAYSLLNRMLYQMRQYPLVVQYSKKARERFTQQQAPYNKKAFMHNSNTLALGYHRQGYFDSAMRHYSEALAIAKNCDSVWFGIISGNMGQCFLELGKPDTAYGLLMKDYKLSLKRPIFYDNAANSLQWAARAQLAKGRALQALKMVHTAFNLLAVTYNGFYYQNTCFTAMQAHKAIGNMDSAFYYSGLYYRMEDSIQRVINSSTVEIARLRLNEKQNRYGIISLKLGREKQLRYRNLLLGAITLVIVLGLFALYRSKSMAAYKVQRMQHEKQLVESEMALAKQEMELFRKGSIEKMALIEQLEQQVQLTGAQEDKAKLLKELNHFVILTEDDWLHFRGLFEKIYPSFFDKLLHIAPGITLAELRMAALSRLQLTGTQMSGMLGIGLDSVHKTRQRLKHRLQMHLSPEVSLDKFLNTI